MSNLDKYITTNNFHKFSGTISGERLKQEKLATTDDIADFDEKLRKVNIKLTSNITKNFVVKKKVSKMLTVEYNFFL